MSSLARVLILVVAIELLGVIALTRYPRSGPAIPVPGFSRLDPVTLAEIQSSLLDVKNNRNGALQSLADRYLALGYFTEAELCFRTIVEQTPDAFDAALRHGICLDRLGQTGSAIKEYRRAAALAKPGQRPSAEVCIYHAGRCSLREENLDAAERAFRETGEFPLGQFQLAKLLARTDRTAEALVVLEPLMKAYPDELKLLLLKAFIARSLKHDREATELVEQCERARDRFFVDSTIEFLGLLRTEFGLVKERAESSRLATHGKVPEAIRRLQQTLAAGWDQQTALLVVDLQLQLRDARAAHQLLDELTERAGLLPETLERRGDADLLLGKLTQAADSWTHAVRLRPATRVFQKLAALSLQMGQVPQSRDYQGKAFREAGIDAYRSNSVAQAKSLLSQAVEALPQDSRSWFYLAAACRAAAQFDEADRAAARYLELEPGNVRSRH